MKIAMICSGLGNILRGHEVFVQDVFELLRNDLDMTLFKGGGTETESEVVVPHIPRYSPLLDGMHVLASPKWRQSVEEERRLEIEMTTFSYSVLRLLLANDYDIIHCTENRIVETLYANRLLFGKIPKLVFSNGGALSRRELPRCDFVQEHTAHNLTRGAPEKSFLIPHGVDLGKFDPGRESTFREEHQIPKDALLILSVGTICFWHKRMDYLIEQASRVEGAYLVIVGDDTLDSPKIRELGERLMGDRIRFMKLLHQRLPEAYKAADVFVLASTFETFGIAYIEAMAMGVPVIATDHVNQRQILKKAVFIDMTKPGNLTRAIETLWSSDRARLGAEGRKVVETHYDLSKLKDDYIAMYKKVHQIKIEPPRFSFTDRLRAHLLSLLK